MKRRIGACLDDCKQTVKEFPTGFCVPLVDKSHRLANTWSFTRVLFQLVGVAFGISGGVSAGWYFRGVATGILDHVNSMAAQLNNAQPSHAASTVADHPACNSSRWLIRCQIA